VPTSPDDGRPFAATERLDPEDLARQAHGLLSTWASSNEGDPESDTGLGQAIGLALLAIAGELSGIRREMAHRRRSK